MGESLGRRLYYGRESGNEAVLWERAWEGGCTIGESLGMGLYYRRESGKEAVL